MSSTREPPHFDIKMPRDVSFEWQAPQTRVIETFHRNAGYVYLEDGSMMLRVYAGAHEEDAIRAFVALVLS